MTITEALETILGARYGREVRQAIHDGIKQAYDDAIKNGNANMEVSQARGSYTTLAERLIADFNNLNSDKISKGNVEASDLMQSVLDIIDKKIAKGNVTMADLTQEVKEVLNGDRPLPIVGKDSVIGYENIVDGTVTPDKIYGMKPLTATFTTRYYINTNGKALASNPYCYSSQIPVVKGQTVYFYGKAYDGIVSLFTFRDSKGTVVKSVTNGGVTADAPRSAVAEQDGTVVVCAIGTKIDVYTYFDEVFTALLDYGLKQISQQVSQMGTLKTHEVEEVRGYYIQDTTGKAIPSNPYFYSKTPIELAKGETIIVDAKVPDKSVAVISLVDSTGKYTPVVLGGNSVKTEYKYTATNSCKVVVSAFFDDYQIKTTFTNDGLKLLTNQMAQTVIEEYEYLINAVICLGDSLTMADYYALNGSSSGHIFESYPYYLSRMTDWKVSASGVGGLTPSNWFKGTYRTQVDFTKFDSMVLWFGTNGGLTDTLSADTQGATYNDYADTETGNYCKIIEFAKSVNPNINIFLIKVINSSGSVPVTNSVIDQIATKYGLPSPIDLSHLANGVASNSNVIHTNNSVHFTKVGNVEVAKSVKAGIVKGINQNPQAFEKILLGFNKNPMNTFVTYDDGTMG